MAGDWEGWLKFFLRGVATVSREATDTAREIAALRESHRASLPEYVTNPLAFTLLDRLYAQPICTTRLVEGWLDCSNSLAAKLIGQFQAAGLLREMTGFGRNRRYSYHPYLALFPDSTRQPAVAPADRTASSSTEA